MANTITTAVTWDGIQTLEYYIKPMFVGIDPRLQGFRVMPNIKSGQKLNYFGSFDKITKAWVQGFSASSQSLYTQREINVHRQKAELAQNPTVFLNTVFEQALKTGVDANSMTGTIFEGIVMSLFQSATKRDFNRYAWLGDTYKETLVSSTYGNYSGTADTNYNTFDGFWKLIFDNAATTPTADQIKRVSLNSTTYIATAAVAQVATGTPSLSSGGSGGAGTITVNGVGYTITYATDVATTITNFVAANSAALLLRNIVLTGTSTTVVFTSSIVGRPFTAPTFVADSGSDLLCSFAATTPNVAPGNLTEDKALTVFRKMIDAQPKVLKEWAKNDKIIMVTSDLYTDYRRYLQDLGTEMANTVLIDGIDVLKCDGILIVENDIWDNYEDDFPHADGSNPAYKTRAILTTVGNWILGVDGTADDMKMQYWNNLDEQEDRMRVEYSCGAQYIHPDYAVVAY